jgi:hypothetical protein
MRPAALLLFMLSMLAMASLVSAAEPAPLAVSPQNTVSLPDLSTVLDSAPGACLIDSPAQVQSGVDLEILSPQALCSPVGHYCRVDANCCGTMDCFANRCG